MSRLLKNIPKDRKIYGNCRVLSPNGILMFRCDEKKANWYLKRNLGEIVSNKPLVVKLNFKPSGLGNHNKEFGLSDMPNVCVVCGTKNHLTRHHVVPYCYRKNLPLEIKSHNHHDILPLCVDCHENYEKFADDLKIELSIKYEAPLNGESDGDVDTIKLSKISSTILRNDLNIPKKRVVELREIIKSFFGIKRLTNSKLLELTKIKQKPIQTSHGELVIGKVDNLQLFVELWRKHFIDTMNPQFLPDNWKIDSKL